MTHDDERTYQRAEIGITQKRHKTTVATLNRLSKDIHDMIRFDDCEFTKEEKTELLRAASSLHVMALNS